MRHTSNSPGVAAARARSGGVVITTKPPRSSQPPPRLLYCLTSTFISLLRDTIRSKFQFQIFYKLCRLINPRSEHVESSKVEYAAEKRRGAAPGGMFGCIVVVGSKYLIHVVAAEEAPHNVHAGARSGMCKFCKKNK